MMSWNDLYIKAEPKKPAEKKKIEEMFTIKELSEITKLAQSTIFKYMRQGIIPYKKIGGSTRFTSETVRNLTTN